ncbi:MAG TPA: SUKH-3 domain-containing protein [Xanthobacteraceae bacterium]|nr:SUKH-3 domain-containing protein [Xanthobacteraceae bacterium]
MDMPVNVRPLFVAAGWHAGRCVAVDERLPARHPAHDVLQEMGGLYVGRTEGGGIECARSDLQLDFSDECAGDISTWSALLRRRRICVGEFHNGHGWLLLDEAGRCFGANAIDDVVDFAGRTFAAAVEGLLLGRRARPMLRREQQEARLYGERFPRGHPAIFDYESGSGS